MRHTLVGEHTDLLVDGEITVNGAVHGATVPSGCHLTVNGSMSGPVSVEQGGGISVYGAFAPGDVENQGVVMVGGTVTTEISQMDALGYFALSPGSVIGRSNLQLQADGSVKRLEGGNHSINIDGNTWCAWIASEQRFVPLKELQAANYSSGG